MSSEQARSAVAQRRNRRLAGRYGPWALWSVALIVTVWIGTTTSGAGMAPGEAEVRQVVLTSPELARVTAIYVALGDKVSVDQPVAQLDTTAVQADLTVAQAELKRMELDVTAQDATLRVSTLETAEQLEGETERAAMTVAQLEAQEQRDKGELKQLDEQIARQQSLVDEKLASAETLNQLKLRRAALSREVAEYRRTLAQARANAKSASRRLQEWRNGKAEQPISASVADDDARLAPYLAAVDAQRERVAQLQAQLAVRTLRAPFEGRVGQLLLRVGDTALQGGGVVSLIDHRPKRVIAYADQMWAHRVGVGDLVRLQPSDRSGAARRGRVAQVGASITEMPLRFRPVPNVPSYCRELYIELEQSDTPPLPGQAFDVTFRRAPRVAATPRVQEKKR